MVKYSQRRRLSDQPHRPATPVWLALVAVLSLIHLSSQQNPMEATYVYGYNSWNQPPDWGIMGVEASTNRPGSRAGAAMCVDSIHREIWLFGGDAYGPSALMRNDLWRYSIDRNSWTWMNGTQAWDTVGIYGIKGQPDYRNGPGCRNDAILWCDSQNHEIWLFGGSGYGIGGIPGYLNDVWRFSANESRWTWMAGYNTTNQFGSYGTKGVPSLSNAPGPRENPAYCYNPKKRELWVQGGTGYSCCQMGPMNDLWRFRLDDTTWTWMYGWNSSRQPGVYSPNLGVPDPINVPENRVGGRMACDSDADELWLYGGAGYNATNYGFWSIVWKYHVSTNLWSWETGSQIPDPSLPVYGTQGVGSVNNRPGGRRNFAMWYIPSNHDLWVWGGAGYDINGVYDSLNDLWRFNTIDRTWTWIRGGNLTRSPGFNETMGVASEKNIPGSRHVVAYSYDESRLEFWVMGGFRDLVSQIPLPELWKFNTSRFVPPPVAAPELPPQSPPERAPEAAPAEAPASVPMEAPVWTPVEAPSASQQASPQFSPSNPPQASQHAPVSQSTILIQAPTASDSGGAIAGAFFGGIGFAILVGAIAFVVLRVLKRRGNAAQQTASELENGEA